MSANLIPSDDIRAEFSRAMSKMYRVEVPLYGELVDIVATVNAQAISARPDLLLELGQSGGFQRLDDERHGAIRIGTAEELSILRRAFAIMGMYPVGYYDLSVAGVPVHSTVFRPTDPASMVKCPFRIFTSLLRLELIEEIELRELARETLKERSIVDPVVVDLIEKAERDGGLNRFDATRFVIDMTETFKWRPVASVDRETYESLHRAHRLIADVVSFQGPHINHLTTRALDIDAAQQEMVARGIDAKSVIEGPPPRAIPILLRQTSFKALEEPVRFPNDGPGEVGAHTARFGEIEQRGAALTPKGRALYDSLLSEAHGAIGPLAGDYQARLEMAFARFPDTEEELRKQGLAYFTYSVAEPANSTGETDFESLIASGRIVAKPQVYEDFLPVSAAGIFQSNLGGTERHTYSAQAAQRAFELALGSKVIDPMELYGQIEKRSLGAALSQLSDQASVG